MAQPPAWEVSDGSGTLWLLGSVHYLRAEDYPLPDLVEALYERADALVMELDLDDLDPSDTQGSLLAAAMLPPEHSLQSMLDEAVWAHLDAQARTLGVSLENLDRFEPWLVALTLLDLGLSRAGYGAAFGLEQHLLRRAIEDGRELLGLETLAQQISVFDTLTPQMQQELLAQTLVEIDTSPALVTELVTAWRAGDEMALAAVLQRDVENRAELHEAVVVARNRRWVSEIERLLAEQRSYLVVVGALHLVGPVSLVELLKDRGHRVRRVVAPPL